MFFVCLHLPLPSALLLATAPFQEHVRGKTNATPQVSSDSPGGGGVVEARGVPTREEILAVFEKFEER